MIGLHTRLNERDQSIIEMQQDIAVIERERDEA